MKRRDFLCGCSGLLLSMLAENQTVFGAGISSSGSGENILKGVMIIDAHAHPDEFYSDRFFKYFGVSTASTGQQGVSASVFNAFGDRKRGSWKDSFLDVMGQLDNTLQHVRSGRAKLVLTSSDIPIQRRPGEPVGCILGIEGGDLLQGDLKHVDDIYRAGVRIITLGHFLVNDFTDVMTESPKHGGLSSLGKQAIGKMDALGIVIDVAHASFSAIKDIARITRKPLIDSHTSVCDNNKFPCGRYRTWSEMEHIAKTGGLVCTWPLARRSEGYKRQTFHDWAKEILEMKKRIGIEHVGLGTDGGGRLPAMIDGYDDVRDLRGLAAAMREVGLSRDDIRAYMGGNFYRVFKAYTG